MLIVRTLEYKGIKMEENNSEFGKGLTYNLALFLAHQDRYMRDKNIYEKEPVLKEYINDLPSSWFNASSDHLYDLQIPENYPEKLKLRLKRFQNEALNFGHNHYFENKATEKDVKDFCRECKDILMEIDKLIGVQTQKGEFE